MVKSKRDKFFDSYLRQNFSLPSDSIIYYISKNPSTSNLYKKMIKTCKYFFIKNPILVISEFSYFRVGKWQLCYSKRRSDFSKLTSKLWIQNEFYFDKKGVYQNILSSLMPKVYRCDAKYVTIENSTIFFGDLSLLFLSVEEIYFRNITVKDKNGLNVALEKIVEIAVKAKNIKFWGNPCITSETLKELLKIPHFLKLDEFTIQSIPEVFDLSTFYNYMKKNKTTNLWLEFDDSISETYKIRLEKIIDEILATENHVYKAPCIYFDGQDWENWLNLRRIYYSL